MKYMDDFSDQRNKAWCIHCGKWLEQVETNHDHVPSKGLLLQPYPEELPVIEICMGCNTSFSSDEEYLQIFLECVLAGSTESSFSHNPKIRRALDRNSNLKSRLDQSRTVKKGVDGSDQILWKPEPHKIQRVILKNARGHAYYEIGEPLLEEPSWVHFIPLHNMSEEDWLTYNTKHFPDSLWPEVGSRMLDRLVSGEDMVDDWVIVQRGIYRYRVQQIGASIAVKSIVREYLATEVIWK